MQPDQLVLPVDPLNNGTVVNETFTRFEAYQNRTSYIGPLHAPDARNTLAIYRTFPTKSGNFKGTAKTSVKFTEDLQVAGVDSSTTLTAPIILDLSFSVPIGATIADVKHLRQRLMALIDNDSFMDALNVQLMV
jgi:hypothetical protein